MLRQTQARGGQAGILTLIAAAMCGVTNCSRSAVFLLDAGGAAMRGAAAYGFPPAVAALEADVRHVPLAAAALDANAPVRCRDDRVERCLPRSWADELRLTDPVFVPLISGSGPVALVLLDGADVPDQAWPEARREAAAYARVAAEQLRAQLPHQSTEPATASTPREPVVEPERRPSGVGRGQPEPVLRFQRPEPEPPPDRPRLTDQELKVVRFVADGLTNPEIGTRLGLSRHTVKEYLSHAMRKLESANRVEAVRRAGALGLLDGTETVPAALHEAAWSSIDRDGEPGVESFDLKVPAVKFGRLADADATRLAQ